MKKEIEQKVMIHGKQILAIFPQSKEKDPVKLCRKLWRLELAAREVSVDRCNGVVDETWWFDSVEIILVAVKALLGGNGPPIYVDGCGGVALKIDSEHMRRCGLSLLDDMGGNGIIAPDFNEW